MRYVNQSTKEVVWIHTIRAENPNMSIPDGADCTKLGYKKLIETQAPSQDGYYAVEKEPVNNTQQWELVKIPVYVPQTITARQARLALLNTGLLDDVEAALSQNRAWQIEWEYASIIERTNPIVTAMQTSLNLTEAQVDELFVAGSKL